MAHQIGRRALVLCSAQVLVFITAMDLAILFKVPWAIVAGMLVLSAEAVRATILGEGSRSSLVVGWGSTLLVWAVLLLELQQFYPYPFDEAFLFVAWLMVAGIWIAARRMRHDAPRFHWRTIGLTWGFLASGLWLVGSYLQNKRHEFHLAILGNLAVLIACRVFFRPSGGAIQFVNTLILLLIGIPVTDAFLRPSYRLDGRPDTAKHYYSYEVAKEDPTSFARWWNYFLAQWLKLHRAVAVPDPQKILPYLFRTNSHCKIFESEVSINSLGFRGPEIELEKGDAYRIVALGESTTFGCTITAKDETWPRLLERMLMERLKSNRSVQVINAGAYGFSLRDNLHRMKTQILPLKPDMIISYHGFNGFASVDAAVPPLVGTGPPLYVQRPLKILADFEYRLKMMSYKRSQTPRVKANEPLVKDPLDTDYARAYEELIEIAQTNHIRLVLANFSMAVNARSDPDVVTFYRAGFSDVLRYIKANAVHSEIVSQLAKEHPEIRFVDTHRGLDGRHEKFIDLVHFTQEGRQQLAETFFDAIKDVVAEDLAKRTSATARQ